MGDTSAFDSATQLSALEADDCAQSSEQEKFPSLVDFGSKMDKGLFLLTINTALEPYKHATGKPFPSHFPLNDRKEYQFRDYCVSIPEVFTLFEAYTAGTTLLLDLGKRQGQETPMVLKASLTERMLISPQILAEQHQLREWWLMDAKLHLMSIGLRGLSGPPGTEIVPQSPSFAHLPRNAVLRYDAPHLAITESSEEQTQYADRLLASLIDFKYWPHIQQEAITGPFATQKPIQGFKRVITDCDLAFDFEPEAKDPNSMGWLMLVLDRTDEPLQSGCPTDKEWIALIYFLPVDDVLKFYGNCAAVYWSGFRCIQPLVPADQRERILAKLSNEMYHRQAEDLINTELKGHARFQAAFTYQPEGHSPHPNPIEGVARRQLRWDLLGTSGFSPLPKSNVAPYPKLTEQDYRETEAYENSEAAFARQGERQVPPDFSTTGESMDRSSTPD